MSALALLSIYGIDVLFDTSDDVTESYMNRWTPKRLRYSVLWSTFLAWTLRVAWLGRKALWIDEADSYYFAIQPLRRIIFGLCDPHPPGYYLLLNFILKLGRSEFWLRFPSALVATLAVPLLFAVGSGLAARLGSSRPTRIASLGAFLLAVAPLHVWYAQEARMYALVTTLGLLVVLCSLRCIPRLTFSSSVGYVTSAAVALLVDQTFLIPWFLANLLWVLTWKRHRSDTARRGWVLALWLGLQLLVAAPFLAWWSRALYPSVSNSGRLYQLAMIMQVLRRLGFPIALHEVRWLVIVGGALGVGLLSSLYLAFLRHRHTVSRGWALLLALLFVLGTLGSAVPRLFTVKRLLLPLLPYAVLASAWSLDYLEIKGRSLMLIALGSILLCMVNLLLIPKGSWPQVAAWIESRSEPDDVIWVDAMAAPAFEYYFTHSTEVEVLQSSALEDFEIAWTSDQKRLWLVVLTSPYRNLLDYLPATVRPALVAAAKWPNVSVLLYDPMLLDKEAPVLMKEPPSWLIEWPSPLDPACHLEE